MDYDNGFILQKAVDWSLLRSSSARLLLKGRKSGGMTIPVSVCSLFTPHHIDYFTRSQNNDSTNIIIICPNYHRNIHKNRSSCARLLPKGRKNPRFNRRKFYFEFENGEFLPLKLYEHLRL